MRQVPDEVSPLAFKGPALAWLMNLEDGSVSTWEELRRCFLYRFRNYDRLRLPLGDPIFP